MDPICAACKDPGHKVGATGMDSEATWICEWCWGHPPAAKIAEWEAQGVSPCVHPDCDRMLGEESCEEHHLPSFLVFLGFQP